jgi:hypothetical protein
MLATRRLICILRWPFVIACGAGIAVLAVALISRAPSGDPGAHILGELRPASAAVPADARIGYRRYVEPRWDSCDGRSGTFGWDDVVVIVHFATTLSPDAVKKHADTALRPLGWLSNPAQHEGDVFGYRWTKTLSNGTAADAQLSNESQDPETWDLYVGAPPVGPRVSGC